MAISFPWRLASPDRPANGLPFYVLMTKDPTVFEKLVGIMVLLKTAESRFLSGYTPMQVALFRSAIRHIVVP